MTLQGVAGMSDAMKAFVHEVRLFLRDAPELNRITAGEESSDRMIAWSVMDALSRFNGTPHVTFYTLEDLLAIQQNHLLLRMTVETLLESIGLLQTRNHLNYSAGGINVGVNDKTPLILEWLRLFKSTTEQRLQQVKVGLNVESILGSDQVGVHSEYWFVNMSYLRFLS